MFIATFVRCLSILDWVYISFRSHGYRIDHEQNGRSQHDISKWLEDCKKCIMHRFSYQIFSLQAIEDPLNISDTHKVKEDYHD